MKHVIPFIISSFFCWSLTAQTLDKTTLEKQIDSIFKQFASTNSPGAAVTVLQNGAVIAKKHYGLANLEHEIPFTHQSPVRMVYSMGREFMSVGLALMDEQGLLSFDDKVRSYFPKLPEWSKDVTIQDLLNHSSGFDDEWSLLLLMTADMRSQVESEQVMTLLYNQPKPQVEPGKGYMYNNTDFALLRFIMEIAAKEPLPDYLKKHLFDPLQMSSTFMNDNVEAIIPGFAENYYGYSTLLKARFIKYSPGGNYRMVTTADDLEKWALAIEDTTSIVAKGYKRLYKNARAIPVITSNKHYVFGHEWHTVNGTEVVYYGGVGDSYYLIRIPSLNISVIGLGNAFNFIDPTVQLAKSFLPPKKEVATSPRFFPATQATVTNEDIEPYTGRYFAQQVGYNSHIPSIRFYDLKIDSDGVKLYPDSSGQPFAIMHFGDGYFKDMEEDVKLKFARSEQDAAMKMEVWFGDGEGLLTFLRNESKVVADSNYLQQFTGQFYSPHLDYYLRIVLNDQGQLIIKRPTIPETLMEAHSEDRFLVEQKNGGYSVYMMATFTKNEKGEVTGFNLRDSRMMHHQFDKVD